MASNNRVTLNELVVERLFGRFDYRIPLTLSSGINPGITIITAPNGYGKSTLLRLVADISRGNYAGLAKVNFAKVTLLTAENIALIVDRESNSDREGELRFYLSDGESETVLKGPWAVTFSQLRDNEFDDDLSSSRLSTMEMVRLVDRYFPSLKRIGPSEWRDSRTGRLMSRHEVMQLLEMEGGRRLAKVEEPDWLTELRTSLQVLHIPANRLRIDFEPAGPRRIRSTDMVEVVAERVSDLIKGAIRQYADQGRRLEQGFPNKIIKALRNRSSVTQDDVLALADDIRQREVRFQMLGLISQGQTDEIDRNLADSAAMVVLKTYLEDIKQKFSALEDTAERLRIFVETINSLLIFKSLKPSIDVGFRVVGDDAAESNIPLSALSSGEQHLIVLLGELVFGTSEGTLILLDEPEISFHPEWQERFPRVLSQIVEINRCSVVMATHSPTLVQDNWDSVVELADQVAK